MLHDPLSTSLVIQPDLVEWESLRVEVETHGRITTAVTLAKQPSGDAPIPRVALRVDPARAEAFVISRMSGQLAIR